MQTAVQDSAARQEDNPAVAAPTPAARRSARRVWLRLLAVLLVAAALRLALLATDAFTFNADEAVVALMARHIHQGQEFPVFFYGQAYMGSLDAILISVGYAVLGESVLTVRLVQSILYLGVVATTFWLGWRLTRRAWAATAAGLLVAVPPVVMTLYTTATLGGYNEVLLLGNLLLIYGYDVTHGRERSAWRWALIGALAGLGWWTNGLIVAYFLPVGLMLLRHLAPRRAPYYGLAFLCFMIFSAPWWQYNFTHNNAALEVFLSGRRADGTGFDVAPASDRLIGLLFLGLPAAIGLRFPWSGDYFAFPVAVLVPVAYVAVLAYAVRHNAPRMRAGARAYLTIMIVGFCVIFVASTFGTDPTGRYFLPIVPPLAVLVAGALDHMRGQSPARADALAAGLLAFALLGNAVAAVRQPPGITTQFDLISHIPHDHDDELMAFLHERNLTRGYASYWVAFRLAFLSQETIILRSALPYKADLTYNPADDRYPPYRDAVNGAETVVYITANNPILDDVIRQRMADHGVTFEERAIGPYRVFHDLSRRISPHELGLDHIQADSVQLRAPSPGRMAAPAPA
ncbi:MAG: glycosyltransferase family 39 protein [Anaerolineae bacterium]|nr:glycosyltransferase family 39 protein [Anaerolineae bacterium]